MKTVTNQLRIRRRRAQAIFLSLVGTAVLVGGLILNFQSRFGAAYVALLVGTWGRADNPAAPCVGLAAFPTPLPATPEIV